MLIDITTAADLLLDGKVVAVPTETVYGLGASLSHPEAIDQVFALKNRPRDNPLIVHVADLEQVQRYCLDGVDLSLAKTFWPGPLTLVLPIDCDLIPENVRAGLPTVAFRIPSHPMTLELLRITGPLVMPSANISGNPSSTIPEHVEQDFGEDFPVLDGGRCSCGLESTILIDQDGKWTIGRLGAVTAEKLAEVLGYIPEVFQKNSKLLCPGQKYRHYAPRAKLVIDTAVEPETVGVVVGYSDRKYEGCEVFSLGSSEEPEEVAQNLYSVFRELDEKGIGEAWVDLDFPENGLWKTVRERISKASI